MWVYMNVNQSVIIVVFAVSIIGCSNNSNNKATTESDTPIVSVKTEQDREVLYPEVDVMEQRLPQHEIDEINRYATLSNEDESAEYEVSSNELYDAKTEVLDKAKQYAKSTACSTTFDEDSANEMTSEDNVYPLNYEKWSSDSGVSGSFLVLWGGDVGCMGGTGTWSYSLTEFQWISDTRPFTVLNENLLEDFYETSEINTRFIQDVSYNDQTKSLEVISYDFAPDDLNNFPSDKYRYNFKNLGNTWSLSNKVKLN